jgi:hypothetical protein
MKKKMFPQIANILALAFASVLVVTTINRAADQQDEKVKFEHYRNAIRDAFQIDIKGFKDKLRGGMANRRPVTDYDLEQSLTGIKV